MTFVKILIVIYCVALYVVNGHSIVKTIKDFGNVASLQRNKIDMFTLERFLTPLEENANEISRSFDTVRLINARKISSNKVFYDFSSLSRSENIVEAHLHVFLSPVEHDNSGLLSMYSLNVQDLFSHRNISRQLSHVNFSHWYKLSLVRWTKRWLKSPRLNQGVEIVLRRNGKMSSEVEPINDEETSSSSTPYLVVYCQTNAQVPSTNIIIQHSVMSEGSSEEFNSLVGKQRVRRHSRSITCNSSTVVVTVRIAASSDVTLVSNGTYTTKNCTGSCQTSRSANASAPCTQNCCVPGSTKPFPYMYSDGIGVVTLKVIPHAIVEQCYCSGSIPSTTASPT